MGSMVLYGGVLSHRTTPFFHPLASGIFHEIHTIQLLGYSPMTMETPIYNLQHGSKNGENHRAIL